MWLRDSTRSCDVFRRTEKTKRAAGWRSVHRGGLAAHPSGRNDSPAVRSRTPYTNLDLGSRDRFRPGDDPYLGAGVDAGGDNAGSRGRFLHRRREESDEQLAMLIESWGNTEPVLVAEIYAWRGENDIAFEWLSRNDFSVATLLSDMQVISTIVNPAFHGLHDDPRWGALLEDAGLSDRPRAALEFSNALPSHFRRER